MTYLALYFRGGGGVVIVGELQPLPFDPRGRPTVTAGSDHYFRTFCSYALFKILQKNQSSNENSDRYLRDYGSGRVDH